MAEIRVAKPARGSRAWLWLVPLVLLLAVAAWFMMGRNDGRQTAAGADTTTSAGVIAPAPTAGDTGARAVPAAPSDSAARDTGAAARDTAPGRAPR
jgi:hypothetical protein